MAVGDVRFHQFGGSPSQIRKKFSLVIGRYVVIAKAEFRQNFGTYSTSFGALQLFFGYDVFQQIDQSVVYLGPSLEATILSGNAVLEVAVDVKGDPSAEDPERGQFLFQALTSDTTIHDAKLIVLEMGRIRSLTSINFPKRLRGVEERDAAISRIRGGSG